MSNWFICPVFFSKRDLKREYAITKHSMYVYIQYSIFFINRFYMVKELYFTYKKKLFNTVQYLKQGTWFLETEMADTDVAKVTETAAK